MSIRQWLGPALIVLEPILIGALIIYFANLTNEARAEAKAAKADLASVRAKLAAATVRPTTPEGQLAHFVEHCNESMIWLDLKRSNYSCSQRPDGDGINGRMIVCGFRDPTAPSDPPGFVVCDKTGCSWSVRNGIGP